MLALAHREHGKLPWSSLFGDAERTARDGFVVSPRLGRMIAGRYPQNQRAGRPSPISPSPTAPWSRPATGCATRPMPPSSAASPRKGPAALYSRPDRGADRRPRPRRAARRGSMTMADLAAYRPVEARGAVPALSRLRVCVPPPPSSGVGLLQLMAMLERTDIAARGPNDPQAWFLFAEASRLMYADRDRYVGDPAFVAVPVEGLLDPAYVAARAGLIGAPAGPPPQPGTPAGRRGAGADATLEPAGTSHFIVVDARGQCRVDDHHGRIDLRLGPDGRRLLPQQPADRFLVQPRDAQGGRPPTPSRRASGRARR